MSGTRADIAKAAGRAPRLGIEVPHTPRLAATFGRSVEPRLTPTDPNDGSLVVATIDHSNLLMAARRPVHRRPAGTNNPSIAPNTICDKNEIWRNSSRKPVPVSQPAR